MADEFLTVAEVAELLKLNRQTVRNMVDRGDLPAVRVGTRRVRILRSDLDESGSGAAGCAVIIRLSAPAWRVRLHADLTILSRLASQLVSDRAAA